MEKEVARSSSSLESEVEIEIYGGTLKAILGRPEGAKGTVIFAHGSGSSRLSVRNNFVAHELQRAHLSTLLLDLLLEEEAQDHAKVFDVALLAKRLSLAKHWVLEKKITESDEIGYFGASTGAAAAMIAAAESPANIFAVVSRGGRPDLALGFLPQVSVPTLFIVGENDRAVLEFNQRAYKDLMCPKQLDIIAGATHLFQEEGALKQVALLARNWFLTNLECKSCLHTD